MRVDRSAIHRRAASISVAVFPFALVFGVTAAEAGLSPWAALGYSTLVFAGSAQFAAVDVLGDGGTVAAAVSAGLLLNLRSLAFGVIMAPALIGPWWRRALESQLMIDESTAVGVAEADPVERRYAYLVAGAGVFVLWNLGTLIGVTALGASSDLTRQLGLDAAAPAAFLALLWPRLSDPTQRGVAGAGALIAFVLLPLTPPGVPIVAAAAAIVAARWFR